MEANEQQLSDESQETLYFQEYEVVLLLEHDLDLSKAEIAHELEAWVTAEGLLTDGAMIDPDQVLTFQHGKSVQRLDDPRLKPKPTQGRFAVVLLNLSDHIRDRPSFFALIDKLNQHLPDGQGPRVSDLLTLKVATPNWYTTAAPGDVGTGGPGAKPSPVANPTMLPLASIATSGNQQVSPVDVYILDSAPKDAALEAAYNNWQSQHALLHDLLGPSGVYGHQAPLGTVYASQSGIQLPPLTNPPVHPKGHEYQMASHGLFVAGIIHRSAPQAKLHLIQVLDDYAVGTIWGITQGLLPLSQAASIPRVVNMSLTLELPLPGHRDSTAVEKDQLDLWAWFAELKGTLMHRLLALAFEWSCLAVSDHNALLVAAGGNDAVGGVNATGQRPVARFPAAFVDVIGVSALDQNNQLTDYSNLADDPQQNEGLSTFGGVRVNDVADPGKSMQGVFIDDFPKPANPTVNQNGWAWWAGTSFAAAVISGKLAARLLLGRSVQAAVTELRNINAGPNQEGEEIVPR